LKKKILIIIILIIIDQLVKSLATKYLLPIGNVTLINGVLELTYVENYGAAFGVLYDRLVLIGLSILIIFVIIKLILSKKYELSNLMKFSYSLILAGGFGNLMDRLFKGFVVDYIDISKIFNYPVFNLADIYIVIGVIIIVITMLIKTVQKQEKMYEEAYNKGNK